MIESHLKFPTGLVVDYESPSLGSEIELLDQMPSLHLMLLRLYPLNHLLSGIDTGTETIIMKKE
jgi:hypothetical protein